jgi:hypothetical protein
MKLFNISLALCAFHFLSIFVLSLCVCPFIFLQELLLQQFFVNFDAPFRNVDKNTQIVEDVTETQEVLPIRLAQLYIIKVFEKLLQSLILHEVGCDNFLL